MPDVETCQVTECSRLTSHTIIIPDRDGGGSELKMCQTCHNAYQIGKNVTK